MAYNTVCGSGDALNFFLLYESASERGSRCYIYQASICCWLMSGCQTGWVKGGKWICVGMGGLATVDKVWEHPWRELNPRKKRVKKPV